MAQGYMNSCGSTIAEFFMNYVRKKSWFSIANIFHDNGCTTQPHVAGGFICFSEKAGVMFTTGKVDAENTPILEQKYLVVPKKHISFQQGISCFPLEHVQRFDALLYTQIHHYMKEMEEFPLPIDIPKDKIMSMTPDPETGLFSDTDEIELMSGETISAMDLYPDFPHGDYCGVRIAPYQEFQKNQKMFCEACNKFFGLSDCE